MGAASVMGCQPSKRMKYRGARALPVCCRRQDVLGHGGVEEHDETEGVHVNLLAVRLPLDQLRRCVQGRSHGRHGRVLSPGRTHAKLADSSTLFFQVSDGHVLHALSQRVEVHHEVGNGRLDHSPSPRFHIALI